MLPKFWLALVADVAVVTPVIAKLELAPQVAIGTVKAVVPDTLHVEAFANIKVTAADVTVPAVLVRTPVTLVTHVVASVPVLYVPVPVPVMTAKVPAIVAVLFDKEACVMEAATFVASIVKEEPL
jgi:hypothetical protein